MEFDGVQSGLFEGHKAAENFRVDR